VLNFLADALGATPVPVPWMMCRTVEGQIFFANKATGEVTWNHPLEWALQELAGVCRVILQLPPHLRESCTSTLRDKWEAEAKDEFQKWYMVKSKSGQPYYTHAETRATMWQHPSEVCLPAYFLRTTQLEKLNDPSYLAAIGCPPKDVPPDAVSQPANSEFPSTISVLTEFLGGQGSSVTEQATVEKQLSEEPSRAPDDEADLILPPASSALNEILVAYRHRTIAQVVEVTRHPCESNEALGDDEDLIPPPASSALSLKAHRCSVENQS